MRSRRFGVRSRAAVASLALLAAACGSGAGAEGAGNGDCTPAETPVLTLRRLQHTPRGLRQDHLRLPGPVEGRARRPAGHLPGVLRRLARRRSQNVINGFEADVVALSLGPDVDFIADAGLITHDWTQAHRRRHGVDVGRGVRRPSRQPQGIEDFDDLARRGCRGPHAGPGIERRCAVEHRRGLRRGDARSCRRHRGRRGRGADAADRHLQQRDRARQDRPRLDQELRGRQRRRRHHLRERDVHGRRGRARRTRW